MAKRDVEAKRKLLHMLFGIVLVALLMYGVIDKNIILYLAAVGIFFSILSKKYKIPVFQWFLANFERDQDIKNFPGKGFIYYLIGSYLVLLFFPMDIAMPSILVLAFADSVGHLFGIRFGKTKHPFVSTKTMEGFFAGFIAGVIAAKVFVPWLEAIAASFFAMLAEGIEIKIGASEVDDNLLIPLVAGIAIWAVRAFLP